MPQLFPPDRGEPEGQDPVLRVRLGRRQELEEASRDVSAAAAETWRKAVTTLSLEVLFMLQLEALTWQLTAADAHARAQAATERYLSYLDYLESRSIPARSADFGRAKQPL